VNCVKFFCLSLAQKFHSCCDDLEACLLESAINFTDDVFGDRIWLDNGKRSLDWHLKTPFNFMYILIFISTLLRDCNSADKQVNFTDMFPVAQSAPAPILTPASPQTYDGIMRRK
jgi:hypothetical protein